MNGYDGNGSFRFWCQKVLPLVYDNSLSYYELLCKVVDYLNKLIADTGKLTDEMQELYNYVHDYFDNLDIQEQINKKLDEMVTDGTLDNLFAKYFSIKIPVRNVSILKNIAKTTVGTYYETLNYYDGDGVNAIFVVTDKAVNFSSFTSKDGKYFTNISEHTAKKYGITEGESAKANNTAIINSMLSVFKECVFDTSEYYFDTITLPRNVSIDFNNSKIHCTSIIVNNTPRDDHDVYAYIKNAVLYCSGDYGINMTHTLRFTIDNVMFMEFKTGIIFRSGYECIFRNIRAIGSRTNQVGIVVKGGDSHFYDIQMLDVHKALQVDSGINFFTNVHCWLLNSSLFSGSKMIEDNTPGGSWNYYDRVYFDTYNYGMYKTGVSVSKLSNVVVMCDENIVTTANYYMLYNTGDNKNVIIDSIEFRIATINSKLIVSNKSGIMSMNYPGVHPSDYYSGVYNMLTCEYETASQVKVNSGRILSINNMLMITFDLTLTGNTANNNVITIKDAFMNPFSDTIVIESGGTKTPVELQVEQNHIKIRAGGNFNTRFMICVPCVVV